ncbi:LysE family translocator [Yinghuangia seranimata]|uniref:LysE family translocator n=1 Tax=Yinghuangia seranimata TaxID=408067 RepID=UPI00248CD77C|nr:LysE family translocator [Yinghuangia seranimata]MDI2132938.1 LysE family translocator [Yinghuangia seranimata]
MLTIHWVQVAGFLLAVTPMTLTPGTSFALVTQRVAAGSRRDGVLVTFGTVTGLCVHATLAAVGLAAVVMASSQALTAVKILGAVYLVWLGVSTWRSTRRSKTAATPEGTSRWRLPWAHQGSYGQGLWGNVLNPKASSVYLTLVPQFVVPREPVAPQIAVLAVAHVVLALGWLLTWTVAVDAARGVVSAPRFRDWLSRVTAAVLVALGVRTAKTA